MSRVEVGEMFLTTSFVLQCFGSIFCRLSFAFAMCFATAENFHAGDAVVLDRIDSGIVDID